MDFEHVFGMKNMCPVDHEPFCVTSDNLVSYYQYAFLCWFLYLYCYYLHHHLNNIWNSDKFIQNEEHEEICSKDDKVVNIEYYETDTYAIQNIQDEMDSIRKTVKKLKKKIKKIQKGFYIETNNNED